MAEEFGSDVVIVGAGITGLAAAHFLKKAGIDTCVLEKEVRTGGTIRSGWVDGFLIEYGPNSALDTTPVLHDVFSAVYIEDALEYANEAADKRYIVRNGKLNNLPLSPLAFLRTPLFSASSKLRLLKEPFIPRSDPHVEESLAEFVRRRLGSEFLDYAINPFVAGVYAGEPEELSLTSGFPKLHELEQEYGSLIRGAILGARARRRRKTISKQNARLFSFKGGMQTLIDALTAEQAGKVYTKVRINRIGREDAGFTVEADVDAKPLRVRSRALVMAIPTYAYVGMKFDFGFPIREELGAVQYAPVAVVFLGFRSNPARVPLDGFGFLIPKREDRGILGTIWSSTIFPGRAPAGGVALTTYVGGSRQPEKVSLEDDELVGIVRKDLRDLMGIERAPETIAVTRWAKAIPQYRVGHQRIVGAIERFENACPGFHIVGSFRGGISVSDCISGAESLGERVAAELRGRQQESRSA